MKAIVETELLNVCTYSVEVYVEILNTIAMCKDEEDLRNEMKIVKDKFPYFNRHFSYGFGSTHMWVTEPGRKERLIFVEF